MESSKQCPRCLGRLFLVKDLGEHYWDCLNCGYTRDIWQDPDILLSTKSYMSSIESGLVVSNCPRIRELTKNILSNLDTMPNSER